MDGTLEYMSVHIDTTDDSMTRRKERALAQLRADILEGLASGPGPVADAAFWERARRRARGEK
jgi:hypothetical protein